MFQILHIAHMKWWEWAEPKGKIQARAATVHKQWHEPFIGRNTQQNIGPLFLHTHIVAHYPACCNFDGKNPIILIGCEGIEVMSGFDVLGHSVSAKKVESAAVIQLPELRFSTNATLKNRMVLLKKKTQGEGMKLLKHRYKREEKAIMQRRASSTFSRMLERHLNSSWHVKNSDWKGLQVIS